VIRNGLYIRLASPCPAITRGSCFSLTAEGLLSARLEIIWHAWDVIDPAVCSLIALDVAGAAWPSSHHFG